MDERLNAMTKQERNIYFLELRLVIMREKYRPVLEKRLASAKKGLEKNNKKA